MPDVSSFPLILQSQCVTTSHVRLARPLCVSPARRHIYRFETVSPRCVYSDARRHAGSMCMYVHKLMDGVSNRCNKWSLDALPN